MWYEKDFSDVAKTLNTNINVGLEDTEVKKRRLKYGINKLNEKKKENIFIRFIKQFNDFMIIILIVASIVSAGISYMQGENDYFDSIIIIAIVVLNAIMGLIQETKAEKSIESLKKLTPEVAQVTRNGKITEILAEELVPGDIIELSSGNYIPADCRIIESHNLKVEESSLTGETEPVNKICEKIKMTGLGLADMKNMAFMASAVASGRGKAIVTETGMNTKIGKIANMIIENEAPETPIQKKLGEVGKVLGIVCLAICAIVFVIGYLKKIEPIEMFMTSVGLAVAAIPEGLPAIVTIMLSIGVTKMAKKNAIIRKLPAVETLGSSTVICSDKTGTLTQNKMTVVETYSDNNKLLFELGSMCTDCNIKRKMEISTKQNVRTSNLYSMQEKENFEVTGEPTEVAIVNKALKENINKDELYKKFKRIDEIPFDSKRKMMTTIHVLDEKFLSITKGAPDILINRSTKIYKNGKILNLTEDMKNEIKRKNEKMASKALRVIAVCFKDTNNVIGKENVKLENLITNNKIEKVKVNASDSIIKKENLEKDLIFVGLIGMIDPPREGVKEAVKTCRKAGIKTVMITGDHLLTATAIAKDLKILSAGEKVIEGKELDKMSDEILENNIKSYSVFARVTPEHKVRIVKAWQKTGAVVAMTGDGVNDSPALKNADIGIAMGKGGTDVAKNASDMILADDNFVTIIEAIKQGRNIYDNIKKAVHFLIATNIGEITTIFVGLLSGMQSPLLAIQLLWINLVTDSFPAIALGLEKEEEGIMERKPRDPNKSIFADGLWEKIIVEGIMLGALTLFAFSLGTKLYGIIVGRTMAFVTLGISELVHSFNVKSEKSIFKTNILENKFLVGSFILGSLLQIIVVIVPVLANIFELTPLSYIQWLYTILISFTPIIFIEIQKKVKSVNLEKRLNLKRKINEVQ